MPFSLLGRRTGPEDKHVDQFCGASDLREDTKKNSDNGISVIVVAKNEELKIGACLNSIVHQAGMEHIPIEIILVDNASTDRTLELAKEACEKLIVVSNPVPSIACSRNMGWRRASGGLVAYIDADCVAPPDWLSVLHKNLLALNADAVGGGNVPPDCGKFYPVLKVMLNTYLGSRGSVQGTTYADLREVDHLPTLNIMVKREVLEDLDGFDEHFALVGEDADFSCRLKNIGGKIFYIPNAEVIHHQRSSFRSWGKNMYAYGQGRYHLIHKHPRLFSIAYVFPILSILTFPLYLSVMLIYSSFVALRERKIQYAFRLASLYAVTHWCYGLGLVSEFFRKQGNSKNRVYFVVLKNSGNKGDEAIFSSFCDGLMSRCDEYRDKASLYVLAIGPSGVDIRGIPGKRKNMLRMALDIFSPTETSRVVAMRTIISASGLVPVMCARPRILICGGHWFHDLSLIRFYAVGLFFMVVRLCGGRTGMASAGVGPLDKKLSKYLLKCCFGKRSFLSLRDKASDSILRSLGRNVQPVSNDFAFGQKSLSVEKFPNIESDSVVGFTPCAWESFDKIYGNGNELNASSLDNSVRLVRQLIGSGYFVVLIPTMNPEDELLCSRLIKEIGDETNIYLVDCRVLYAGQIQAIVKRCNIMISMRLHPLIFAYNESVPYIAIDYADKVRNFCSEYGKNGLVKVSPAWGDECYSEIRRLTSFESIPPVQKIEYLARKNHDDIENIVAWMCA